MDDRQTNFKNIQMIKRYTIPPGRTRISINDVIKNLFDLLSFKYARHELRYVRVEEKLDTVRALCSKGTGAANE